MGNEWGVFLALAGFALGGISLLARSFDKSLSLREHEEFKRGVGERLDHLTHGQEARLVIREFHDWTEQIRLDLQHLRTEVNRLDANKPTTGELDRSSSALEARIKAVENIIRSRIVELRAKGLP